MANNLPNASNYTTFAYHTNLLADFVKNTQSATASTAAGAGGNRLRRGSTRSAGGGSMRNLGSSFRNKGRASGAFKQPNKGSGQFTINSNSGERKQRAQSVMIPGL